MRAGAVLALLEPILWIAVVVIHSGLPEKNGATLRNIHHPVHILRHLSLLCLRSSFRPLTDREVRRIASPAPVTSTEIWLASVVE